MIIMTMTMIIMTTTLMIMTMKMNVIRSKAIKRIWQKSTSVGGPPHDTHQPNINLIMIMMRVMAEMLVENLVMITMMTKMSTLCWGSGYDSHDINPM